MTGSRSQRPSGGSESDLRDRVEELERVLHDLRESQRFANVGSWDYRFADDLLSWSGEVHRIFGTDPAAFVPSYDTLRTFVHPEDVGRFDEARLRTVREGAPLDVEHRIVRPDGEIRHVRQRGEVRFGEDGQPQTLSGIVQDVTDREQTLQKLRESESLLRIAGRAARLGAWSLDVKSQQVTWSETSAAIQEAGDRRVVSPAEAAESYAPEHRDRIIDAVTTCVLEGQSFDEEYEILTPSGRRVWVRSIGEPVRDGDGRVVRVQGAFQDISDRKKAEGAIREASARLNSVLESLADAFFTVDRQWRITYLNRACEKLLRREREDLLGKKVGEAYPGPAGEVFHENYRRALEERRVVEFEAPYLPLDVWLEVRVHPTAEGLAVSMRDVTDRRREREALRLGVERFRGVARATSDAIWDWNLESDTAWWSEGMETLFGHPLAELEPDSSSWTTRIHPDDHDRALATIDEVIEGPGDEWKHEYRFARKDGTWAWVLDRGFVIRDAKGKAVRMVGGMTDLSDRRQSELELARLNRALRMRSECSESLIRATDEKTLLTEVCRIAVEIGGYRMAWVGYAEDDETRSIRPVAHAGFEDGYLSEVTLSWSDDLPGGRGPAGRAVRSGSPQVLEDLAITPPQTPWHHRARARGYHGIVSLPLRDRGDTFGVLGLYTAETRPLPEDEIALLQNMTDDLAFGVISLRSRRDRERMQVAVSKMASMVSSATKEEFFLQLVRSMCEALGADAGFVATFLPGEPRRAHPVAAIVDGNVIQTGDQVETGRPIAELVSLEEVVFAVGVAERFPGAPELATLGIEAWVGRRLDNSRGAPLGVVVALFREPLTDVAFATSTLRIFASRAAAELERQQLENLKLEQTGILVRIAAGRRLEEVFEASTRLVEAQVHGAVCAISRIEDDGGGLRLVAGSSLRADVRQAIARTPVGPASGTCGTAAHERRTVIVTDMDADPLTAAYREVTAAAGLRAGWAVPFFAADTQVLGTFTVFLPVSRAPDVAELDLVATVAHLIGIAVERERAHAALLASEARVSSTFAAAAAGIAISSLNGEGFFLQANRAFCEMVGYTEEELRGLDATTLTHPDDLPASLELASSLVTREIDRFDIEKRYLRKDGGVVWARVSVSLVPALDGAPSSVIAVTQDITALKAAEEARRSLESQLREAQKMEAIGTLAGGIAHDFNNILGAILGNAELARMDVEGNTHALQSLDEIRRAGLRAKELIRQILSFSRREKSVRRPVALLPIAEESVRLLAATLPSRAVLHLRGGEGVPLIHADPLQLQQVLLNLGTNAVHAMTGRPGSIEIAIDLVRLGEDAVRLHPDLRPGPWLRLSVTDKGHGMDEATRRRIFEPFFTTKPVGEGTGLGLPVVHGIMRDHDGVIVVESAPGVGTRFDLYFPALAAEAAEAPAPPPAKEAATGGREGAERVILYVDDDEGLLSLIQRLLSRRGYEVVGHVEADAALEELRADPDRFDLVLTDYNMPKMSGLDVAREVHEIRADLPVAITSGYITETMRAEAAAAGVKALIFKPDVVDALCDEVARVLAECGTGRRERA
ncbi:MAG: PAS domain-containing protein [Candidatus Binatia bacterium]